MTNVVFALPTYKVFDVANQCIWSAVNNTVPPKDIVVVDNSAGEFVSEYQPITILVQSENIGVARAWNKILEWADTFYPEAYVLISNDDLILNPNTIEQFIVGIAANPGRLIYATAGSGLSAFSLFACNPRQLRETVGWFDEEFFYSYFEDNSMAYRLELYGNPLCFIPAEIKEHKHSATMKSYNADELREHHRKFEQMKSIYISLWGGLPGSEKFKTPYNQKG